jgi:hypothetical protein
MSRVVHPSSVDPVRFAISEGHARFLADIGMVAVSGGNPKLGEIFYINDHPFVVVSKIEEMDKVHPTLRHLSGRVNYFEVSTD